MTCGIVFMLLAFGVVLQDTRILVHDASGARFTDRVHLTIEPEGGISAHDKPIDEGNAIAGVFHARIPSNLEILTIRITVNGEVHHRKRRAEPFICVPIPDSVPLH